MAVMSDAFYATYMIAAGTRGLRRTHVHHRDLRARLRAECFEKPSAPSNTGCASHQDRHLMMPSSLIHHSTDTRHCARLSTASAPTCADPSDSSVVTTPMPSRKPSDRAQTCSP